MAVATGYRCRVSLRYCQCTSHRKEVVVNHAKQPYDPIERVAAQKALYGAKQIFATLLISHLSIHSAGFVQVSYDTEAVQLTLASNVSSFLSQNSHLVPENANLAFVWKGESGIKKALEGNAGNAEWTNWCMYVSMAYPSPIMLLNAFFLTAVLRCRITSKYPTAAFGKRRSMLSFLSF